MPKVICLIFLRCTRTGVLPSKQTLHLASWDIRQRWQQRLWQLFSRTACVSDGPLGFTTSHYKLNWRSMSTCINTMKRSSMVGRSPIQSTVLNCGTKSEEKKMLTGTGQILIRIQSSQNLISFPLQASANWSSSPTTGSYHKGCNHLRYPNICPR